MILTKLRISQFRNSGDSTYVFDPLLTVVIGDNARGKTNLLEAVYVCVRGVGFRETREEELIQFGSNSAMVEGEFSDSVNTLHARVTISRSENYVSKSYAVEKAHKRLAQYKELLPPVVLFSPEQIIMITHEPRLRRTFLDDAIGSVDREYIRKVKNYEQALRRRNKVLEMGKNTHTLVEELQFWNTYLVEQGSYITEKRKFFISFLNSHPHIDSRKIRVEYVPNEFSLERAQAVFERETYVRKTLIGPQKDDFRVMLCGDPDKNVHHFGSRSEQRLAVLWLKRNELRFIESELKQKPILLLDDIFSEFDIKNKKLVMGLITEYQTVLTTTEVIVSQFAKTSLKIIQL